MIVVSDTGPFHYLLLLGEVDILPTLYGAVVIPETVRQEMQHEGTPSIVQEWVASLPDWVIVRQPLHLLPLALDPGEQAAISLAVETGADLVLIDERKGRQVAEAHSLVAVGTLGILLKAAQEGIIDLADALVRLQKTNFYISEAMVRTLLSSQTTEQK